MTIQRWTFLTKQEIDELAKKVASEPHLREAQRTLALEVTSIVHSKEAALAAREYLKEIPKYLFITTNAKNFNILDKINKGPIKKLIEFVDQDGIQRGVSPDLKEAFLVNSKQIRQFNLEKKYLKSVW